MGHSVSVDTETGYCILEEWQAKEVLQHLYRQHKSVRKLAELLHVSKSTLHRCLRGEQSIPLALRARLCEVLSEEELIQVLKGRELLKRYGLVDSEGRLNKAVALALLDAMMQDNAVKEEVLGFLLKYYKKELQERLVEVLPRIELRWTPEFEKWLTEKKTKPISERTLKDYRNIWFKCLEGKILGWHLIKQLTGKKMECFDENYHPTGWIRQIFRHYVNYLYAEGKLDWDTYSRLMLTIPGRKYGRKLVQKPILKEDVVKSLERLKEAGRYDIYMLYLLILSSGARFEHTLRILKEWKPDEIVYVKYLNRNIKRLECFTTHCRYYVGWEKARKPLGFMFFPKWLLELIKKYRDKLPGRRRVEKVVKKNNCLPPSYIRTFAMREIIAVLGDNDVTRFILSKFGELSVLARHYRDLLKEADKAYPKYIQYLENEFGNYLVPIP